MCGTVGGVLTKLCSRELVDCDGPTEQWHPELRRTSCGNVSCAVPVVVVHGRRRVVEGLRRRRSAARVLQGERTVIRDNGELHSKPAHSV